MSGLRWADSAQAAPATAIGTIGAVGQSFSVSERPWACPQCKGENLARRLRCHRCKAKKPADGGGYVMDAAFKQALDGSTVTPWQEALDPKTQHIYYCNTQTGETTWSRPESMGAAPHATGWFGRGSIHKGVQLIAPMIVLVSTVCSASIILRREECTMYLGDHWNNNKGNDPAESRCYTETDAGYTKADTMDSKTKYFCIHFARGMCARGHECTWFHRTPIPSDDANNDQLKVSGACLDIPHTAYVLVLVLLLEYAWNDAIARCCWFCNLHVNHRDDMSGVGSINSPSRTLYVGKLTKAGYKSLEALEQCIWEQFSEWGEVENVNVIHRLSIAFVRYRLRSNCEFAKEAMANQHLIANTEVLNLRWAFDDPNSVAKEAIARTNMDATLAMLHAKGILDVHATTQQGTDDNPFSKGTDANEQQQQQQAAAVTPDIVCLSDMLSTSCTHIAGEDTSTTDGPMSKRQKTSTTDTDETQQSSVASTALAPVWREIQDPTTGAIYYYNEATLETSWIKPNAMYHPIIVIAFTTLIQCCMYICLHTSSLQAATGTVESAAYAVGVNCAYSYDAYGYSAAAAVNDDTTTAASTATDTATAAAAAAATDGSSSDVVQSANDETNSEVVKNSS
eukprot:9056-Heterococcus_DN1.PRE.2